MPIPTRTQSPSKPRHVRQGSQFASDNERAASVDKLQRLKEPNPIVIPTPQPAEKQRGALRNVQPTSAPRSFRSDSEHTRSTYNIHGKGSGPPSGGLATRTGDLGGANSKTTTGSKFHNRNVIASTSTTTKTPPLQSALTSSSRFSVKAASSSAQPGTKKSESNNLRQHHGSRTTKPIVSQSSAGNSNDRSDPGAGTNYGLHVKTDLVQLALLHHGSEKTLSEIRETARFQLETTSQILQHECECVESTEQDRQAILNAHALQSWLAQGSVGPNSNKLLMLSSGVQELHGVCKEGSSFDTAMADFEWWEGTARSRVQDRDASHDPDVRGEHAPAPQWMPSLLTLERNVGTSYYSLHAPAALPTGSSIGFMLNLQKELADHTMQSVLVCREMEGLINKQEEDWIRLSVQDAMHEVEEASARPDHGRDRRGVWDHS